MNRDFNLLKAIALRDKQSRDEERRAGILKRNFCKALGKAKNNIAKRETEFKVLSQTKC